MFSLKKMKIHCRASSVIMTVTSELYVLKLCIYDTEKKKKGWNQSTISVQFELRVSQENVQQRSGFETS